MCISITSLVITAMPDLSVPVAIRSYSTTSRSQAGRVYFRDGENLRLFDEWSAVSEEEAEALEPFRARVEKMADICV